MGTAQFECIQSRQTQLFFQNVDNKSSCTPQAYFFNVNDTISPSSPAVTGNKQPFPWQHRAKVTRGLHEQDRAVRCSSGIQPGWCKKCLEGKQQGKHEGNAATCLQSLGRHTQHCCASLPIGYPWCKARAPRPAELQPILLHSSMLSL